MIKITTKNNLAEELKVRNILTNLLGKYPLPIFTADILVEKGVVPHSHPILTLNTRDVDPLVILQTFVHEQFHWFATGHSNYDTCIEYLKKKYIDNGECNKFGTYPNSFWEHIIVCFNTRMYLSNIISNNEITYIYSKWQAYPQTEQLILEKYTDIQNDLMSFDLIFNKNDLSKIERSGD